MGFFGVYLFFMISGYVIFMTLEACRTSWDFIVSRFSRLYPAYVTALILTFLLVSAIGLPGREVSALAALINLSMVPELLGWAPVDTVYWTLQIELCFYGMAFLLFATGLLAKAECVLVGLMLVGAADYLLGRRFFSPAADSIRSVLILRYINLFTIGVVFYRMKNSSRKQWHWALVIASIGYTALMRDMHGMLAVACYSSLYSWL